MTNEVPENFQAAQRRMVGPITHELTVNGPLIFRLNGGQVLCILAQIVAAVFSIIIEKGHETAALKLFTHDVLEILSHMRECEAKRKAKQ